MPTVGVTGAAGFIGGALVPALAARGYELVMVDNFSGPVHGEHPRWPVPRGDFGRAETLERFGRCDAIVHLAATAGVMSCAEDPAGSYEVNVAATRRLVAWCGSRGVPLAFASSFAVVGIPDRLPITESTPAKPTHAYAAQKAEGEGAARSLAGRDGPGGAILRMSNVYGRYRIDGRVVAKGNVLNAFAEQARSGRLRVNAPGTQRRDYVHLDDVVAHWDAAIRRLLAGSDRTQVPVYNVASGETATVLELAEIVRTHWRRRFPESIPLEVDVVPNPRGAVELLQPEFEVDRSWTETRLGVRCEKTLENSLDAILADAATAAPPATVSTRIHA